MHAACVGCKTVNAVHALPRLSLHVLIVTHLLAINGKVKNCVLQLLFQWMTDSSVPIFRFIFLNICTCMPNTVGTAFARSNTGIVGSNPIGNMDIWVHSVCRSVTRWPCLVQGVPPILYRIRKPKMQLRPNREQKSHNNSIQFFNSLLFMCRVNSYKANYRHSTVQIYITT
jgi:hypothetical protein